ncbi:MAG: GntR family transcriptional regulator [Alphaproteobacteria bacterium]|nr:GntR family transcriptional regulator [Alphaproteobacteria bacterium]
MSETVQGPDFHPLYRQVKELLLQRVVTGHWKPGEMLPSETKLAQEFGVSQGTVRKALEEMAAEHLVVRHQGKGTFVTGRGAEQPVHFFSMTTADRQPLADRINTAISREVGSATASEQKALQIAPDSEVVRVHRIRTVKGQPVILDEIVLVNEQFPDISERLEQDPRANTYVVMEKQYGVLAVRAEEWVCAVAAEPREARALDVEVGAPLLKITRICYALDGKPIELRTMWINSEDCHYYNSVS